MVKVAPWLNAHLEGMGKSGLSSSSLLLSLQRYNTIATNFMQQDNAEEEMQP